MNPEKNRGSLFLAKWSKMKIIIISMADNDLVISGEITQGLQIASGINPDPSLELNNTIFLQKPFFEQANVPDVQDMYNGTINLDISPALFKIITPDHSVTCTWTKNVTERFWFVRTLISYNLKSYKGYIYYPRPSAVKSHKNNVIEILAEKPDINDPDSKFLFTPSYVDIHKINDRHRHIIFVYFVKSKTGAVKLAESEHHEIRWFTEKELDDPKYQLIPKIKFYAKEALIRSK